MYTIFFNKANDHLLSRGLKYWKILFFEGYFCFWLTTDRNWIKDYIFYFNHNKKFFIFEKSKLSVTTITMTFCP